MPVDVVPISSLSDVQTQAIDAQVARPEHVCDSGAIKSWSSESAHARMYAALLTDGTSSESETVIGLMHAGGPIEEMAVAWWIDDRYRGKHLGGPMIDSLAAVLKSSGVTGIGRIPIDTFNGKYNEQSAALARRLKAHFPRGKMAAPRASPARAGG